MKFGIDELKILHLFSGIGAVEMALKRLKLPHRIVACAEIDKPASEVYKALHGNIKNLGDVTQVDFTKIADIDMIVGGFPCQAFSISGKRMGFEDTRGTMFYHFARAINDIKPKFFMWENVKGLLSHDSGKTIRVILEVLSGLGYEITLDLLNAKDFDVPQSRERLFCIGKQYE